MSRVTSPANKICVAILDDHQVVVDGYKSRLQGEPDIEVVGAAAYAEDLEPLLAAHPTDVLLLDINVPESRENPNPFPLLYAVPRLLQRYPELVILVITMHLEWALVQAVMEAGVSGYMTKDDQASYQQLGSVVRSLASGGAFMSEPVRQLWLRRQGELILTPRQAEALSLCAAYPDQSTANLAKSMGIASSTMRNLLSEAYLRLGVPSRGSAVEKARHLGLITPKVPFATH